MVVSAPSTTLTNQGYVSTQTVTPAQTLVVVTQTPPVAQQETVLARPSSDHLWLAGYWTWRNERYEWMPGHWELPPTMGATWVAPRWEQQGNAYRFYEGYWN